MCREPIAYPPAMEGEEIQCQHCHEDILLLMSSSVIFRKGELQADREQYEEAMRNKPAKESANASEWSMRQRIKTRTTDDAIPHLIEPVQLVNGPRQSVTTIHFQHPHRFVIWKSGITLTRKPDMVAMQWAVAQDQGGKGRPVPEINLTARLKDKPKPPETVS